MSRIRNGTLSVNVREHQLHEIYSASVLTWKKHALIRVLSTTFAYWSDQWLTAPFSLDNLRVFLMISGVPAVSFSGTLGKTPSGRAAVAARVVAAKR